jgi:oxygen-dependent protoporphyrinogen oxidase
VRRLVIVGGGISGLAAAEAAHQAACEAGERGQVEIVVLERDASVGGKARTRCEDGWLVEQGPTGFLDREPVLDHLVAAAGLAKLPAQVEAARRYVVRGGRVREIHAHPLRFARSGILSVRGLLRLAAERFVPPRTDEADESVGAFARRRLGRQAAERLVGPMVSGVHAGDAQRISLLAAFPRMRALEQQHGSLLRALGALKKSGRASGGGPTGPGGRLTSFRDGLQALPRALAATGHTEVRTGVAVAGVAAGRDGHAWRLGLEDGQAVDADALLLATEGWAGATLMADALPALAKPLAAVRHPPVAVVALGFGAEALARCPRGFGVLLPRAEGYRMLGVLWDTHLFEGRSPAGTLLLRVLLGGATDTGLGDLDLAAIEALAEREVRALLGLAQPPVFRRSCLWPRAIPQYELGHLDLAAAAAEAVAGAVHAGRPLALAGSVFGGVAFTAAAATGWQRGRDLMQGLVAAR